MIEPNPALLAATVLLTTLLAGMAIGAWAMRAAARRDAAGDGSVAPPIATGARATAGSVAGPDMVPLPNGCVHVFDRDLKLRSAEGEALRRFGLERGQAGHTLRQVFPRDAAQRLEPALRRALLGHGDRFEAMIGRIPVLVACGPLRDTSGEIHGLVLVCQDITEQRARLDALEASRRQCEARLADMAASHRDMETFASNTTRDLRDPLRLLAAYLAVIRQRHGRVLDQDGQSLLRKAEEGARRLDRSLRDMLEYANLDGAEAATRPVPLADAVGRALRDLIVPLQEAGGQVDIRDPLPAVRGAPDQIQRLFRAVLGNALHHRRPGCPPVVTIGCEEDGAFWRVSVSDNGPGVRPEERDLLFEPLRRRSATNPDDSGMALAIARRIVERHGGRIWVMPPPPPAAGKDAAAGTAAPGTTLCFTLPASHADTNTPGGLALRLGLGS